MTENGLKELLPKNEVFNSRLRFALNRFSEVNRANLENGAELRKSSNLAERLIGICGPACHLVLAYTFAPLAIAVAMTDAKYSNEEGGYISRSYEGWLETNRRSREEN